MITLAITSKLFLILVNMNRFTMSMRDHVQVAILWTRLFWWNTALHPNHQIGLKEEKYYMAFTQEIVAKSYSYLQYEYWQHNFQNLLRLLNCFKIYIKFTTKYNFDFSYIIFKSRTFVFHEVYFYLLIHAILFCWLV